MKAKRYVSLDIHDYPESISIDEMYALPAKILALKIPESVKDRKLVGREELNGRQIQACVEEAWRTRQDNFATVDYVFATLPLDSNTRAIVGVYQFDGLQDSETGKRLKRVSFQNMSEAPEDVADKYLGKKITGFHPRDTNPIRYFGASSQKNLSKPCRLLQANHISTKY